MGATEGYQHTHHRPSSGTKGGIHLKWNGIIIRTSETTSVDADTPTRETLFIYLEYKRLHRSTKGAALVGRYEVSITSYLKGCGPRGIRCGGSFVKGCARITCQGLNRSIANSPKPLLNAQKLNTHKHTSSNSSHNSL